ncbi:VOC family protein [Deltaproteobacteria bacterium OttesenSCG-928-M10]|nr:VOC family protein [Deltaproteobacteria bacterium OttesenSCG-928-M10]
MIKYRCPVLIVSDLKRSEDFYEKVLGQVMIAHFGGDIAFSGDFALQTLDSWHKVSGRTDSLDQPSGISDRLYFEEDRFDDFAARLRTLPGIKYLHDVMAEPSGQKVVRFLDPDGHLIEVAEGIKAIIRRRLDNGQSVDRIAGETGYPLEFILACQAGTGRYPKNFQED